MGLTPFELIVTLSIGTIIGNLCYDIGKSLIKKTKNANSKKS